MGITLKVGSEGTETNFLLMKYYKVCRVKCRRCDDVLQYENQSRLDSGRLQICKCRKVALDPSVTLYRILGDSEDYEDLSEEWVEGMPLP